MVVSPLAALATLSGIICVAASELVRRRWTKPGAFWFTVAGGACALWAIAYGIGLVVFDPAWRVLLEVPIWVGHGVAPVAFLLFVAAYTGQLQAVSRITVLALWIVPVLTLGLVVTNEIHGIMWTGYDIAPTAGAATVSYTKEPWLYVHKLYSYAVLAIAAAIVLELFVDRDALYSAQALSLAAVVVPLAAASVAWVLELGPAPQLTLTPFLFGPVFAVASVVLFRSHLFDSPPAARLVGRRRLFEDLGDGVLIVDEQGRIVETNEQVHSLFAGRTLLGQPIETLVEPALPTSAGRYQRTIETDAGRQPYEVTVTPVTDDDGITLGYSLLFQDVSEATRRQQQLAVLNRVLRHNLRNDMTVVQGYTQQIAGEADGEHAQMAATAAEQAGDLIELGEQARRIERALDDHDQQDTDIAELVAGIAEEFPDAQITVDVPTSLSVVTDPITLRAVLFAALDNTVEHGGADPEIEIEASATDNWLQIAVQDDGPGIPEHERTPIEAGTETALEHGSGLGLWLIVWGASHLGGQVTFDSDEGGTTVSLRIPDGDPA